MRAANPFEENLELIERLLAAVCRRNALFGADAEDFCSWARLRLLEGDCAILRKFQGRSSMQAYLATVLANLFRDYRTARWGKWRPSAVARRLGPLATQLETLVTRDGHEVEVAVRMMRENLGVTASEQELRALYARLPRRVGRRVDASDTLDATPEPVPPPDPVAEGEKAELMARAETALAEALAELAGEDRLLLKLRFCDGWSVADIARRLGLEQRPLYTRMERLLRALRRRLREARIDAAEARRLIGWPALDLTVDYGVAEEGKPAPRPSLQTERAEAEGEELK